MTNYIQTISTLNPFLAGLIGTFASGIVLYLLRSIPLKIFQFFFKVFTAEVTVLSSDRQYEYLDSWLNKQNFGNMIRSYKLSRGEESRLIPGYGSHIARFNNKFLFITRSITETVSAYGERPEWINIRIIGFSNKNLVNIVNQICERKAKLNAYIWNTANGYWQKINEVHHKSLDKVILPKSQKDKIVNKLTWFKENQQWYIERGIPYRLGCMFYGPPGTGKTSLITALANKFKTPIFILNIKSITGGDTELFRAVSLASSDSILLIEDIDAMQATDDRSIADNKLLSDKSKDATKVTLSGLLNAIDGITASEGRILCMTTNHREKLDEALTRKARVDLEVELGLMQIEQVYELAQNMFPGANTLQARFKEIAQNSKLRAPAEWQSEFMDYTQLNTTNELKELE